MDNIRSSALWQLRNWFWLAKLVQTVGYQLFFLLEVESEAASSKSSVGLISKAKANSKNIFIETLHDLLSKRLTYVL